jgi:hypothetical protein
MDGLGVGLARFAEMNVEVDEPRHDHLAPRIYLANTAGLSFRRGVG